MSEREYYVHDTTRGAVGNSMVWWKRNNHGYVCDVREARRFKESELPKYLEAGDLQAWPCDYIDVHVEHHVDIQSVDSRDAFGDD